MIGVIEKQKIKQIMSLTISEQFFKPLQNKTQEHPLITLQNQSKAILKGKNKLEVQNLKGYEKLQRKQNKLTEKYENLRSETRKLTAALQEMKEDSQILQEQYEKQEKLQQQNESLIKKNEQLESDIEKFSQMKFQKSIEKFPKKIITLAHLKNQHNNIKIQSNSFNNIQFGVDIHQLEGSMINGDEVEAITGHKTYNILTEVPWKEKEFQVQWKKRTNGYKPQSSWIDGKQLDQYYSQKLFEYYKKNGYFLG